VIRAATGRLLVAAVILLPACAEAPAPLAPVYAARRLGTDETVSLSSLRGQVVLLNAWATWCGPCRQEMPAFERLQAQYRDRGLRVIGVNLDEGEADAGVEAHVRSLGLTFDIWRDPQSRIQKRFRMLGVPETVLIDRGGATVRHWRGAFDPYASENLQPIQQALDRPAAGTAERPDPTPADPVRTGRRVAEQRGCLTCHSLDGAPGQGPTFQGTAGTEVRLADGRTVLRDRAYLARSITDPDAEVVAGYSARVMAGAMPGRPLTASEIEALVAFVAAQPRR
jgi:cytochrome c-type biogenesis protein